MLITFRSKGSANIPMFANDAERLLKIMGHSGTVPGAFLAKDIPNALERLQKGVKNAAPEKTGGSDDEAVSLAKRALPLIQMLEAAASDKCDVMWEAN